MVSSLLFNVACSMLASAISEPHRKNKEILTYNVICDMSRSFLVYSLNKSQNAHM
ncbi:allergenic cerato-platanin asp f13 [Moniliophthora roreri]|nr:allergenic cerato-platanin asp f13 [Moniliophthora roreri]